MVKQTAESQFRCRARKALAEGKDFNVRGGANRVILEELKKEISEGKKRVEASSGSQVEKHEGWESVVRESLSNAAPGDLQFHGGLGADLPDAESGHDAAPVFTEPSAMQPDAEQARTVAPGVMDAESADDAQCEVRRVRRDLAEERQKLDEARAEIERLKGERIGEPRQMLKEIGDLKKHKCMLESEVHSLTRSNNDLRTKMEVALARSHSDAMAHPEVQAICAESKRLQLEKCKLQELVARQVERNDAQAANDSQNADTRPPAKSLKGGFDIGDIVYVVYEYWGMLGKHPNGYDHTTRFVIVNRGFQPGCWDLCATIHMRKQPREAVERFLPEHACDFTKEQMSIQMLYADGHLGDVPGLLLTVRPSPPAPRSERAVYIDLTVNTPQTVVQTDAVH